MSILQRILDRVKVDEETGCWVWQGGKIKGGYAQLKVNGKCRQIHRLIYAIYYGEIPDGLCVCHKCDNPPCCNPGHLFVGTHLDNQRDAAKKGRKASGDNHGTHTHPESYPRGEGNGNSKLTELQVREIRHIHRTTNLSTVKIGKVFGVAHSTIGRIVKREIWRHVEP